MEKSRTMILPAVEAAIATPDLPKSGLGDRIRNLTQQLREADQVQTEATVRILKAAAVMSQNYDRLVDEVVEVVEHDLVQPVKVGGDTYTEQALKQQFSSLKEAKSHFNIPARSWSVLVDKLNERATAAPTNAAPPVDLVQRVMALEASVDMMREEMSQIRALLNSMCHP
jgi:hypothetical protein